MRLGGAALAAAVWILGMVTPARDGLTPVYVATFSGLLAALILVDLTLPTEAAPAWRRAAWLGAEIALAYFVVAVHGTLVRPALIYLLPASRALLLFGPRVGVGASLAVWLAYGLNVAGYAWPDRLAEYPNYLSFFLAPYVVTMVLTLAMLHQAASRRRVQGLYDELSAAHAELRAFQQQAQETAVAEERNRLAREIHDSLAHYLTVINLQLEAAEKLSADRLAEAVAHVQRARRLTLESLQEVRRSVAALRATSFEDLSLQTALAKLTSDFVDATGVNVQIDVRLGDEPMPADVALACYRVAQEGLTNVQRHAHASSACVSLSRLDGGVRLTVSDDGIGPVAADGAIDGGFGLQGLRERVALLGGELRFGRDEPRGSLLAVTIPLPRETS